MKDYDVLEINAALRNLTNQQHITSSAETIIKFALQHTIPSSLFSIEGSGPRKESNSFMGSTSHGNMNLAEGGEGSTEYAYGIHKKRIGDFKLWRLRRTIFFHDFWKSDISTVVTENPEVIQYGIKCTRNFAFKKFGYYETKTIFSYFGISFSYEVFIELFEKSE
jgi:hypothetical protein